MKRGSAVNAIEDTTRGARDRRVSHEPQVVSRARGMTLIVINFDKNEPFQKKKKNKKKEERKTIKNE
jgi:hypothetical protein